VGILCVTFCKKWKMFGWLYFYLKWYCDVWGMLPQHDFVFYHVIRSKVKVTVTINKLFDNRIVSAR
jgi:hypothetical protein